MTVQVIHKTESVIYKKQIYRFGDEFAIATGAGNSLIERGYVKKISDNPAFNDSTVDETEFDRIILIDSANGKESQLYVQDGQAFIDEREV